jgi:REase_DpnII-MboI
LGSLIYSRPICGVPPLTKPAREKDVQNTVEQLFIGRGMEKGIDYDREVGRVKVSTKEVIPDFTLPPLDTAIEVKLLRDPNVVSRVIDEINADIQSYSKEYKTTVFVVYDLGALRDEVEFRRDLESSDGVKVVVVKH